MIRLKFGTETFEHIAYDQVSSYLLLNKGAETQREDIETMFRRTYPVLSDVILWDYFVRACLYRYRAIVTFEASLWKKL